MADGICTCGHVDNAHFDEVRFCFKPMCPCERFAQCTHIHTRPVSVSDYRPLCVTCGVTLKGGSNG